MADEDVLEQARAAGLTIATGVSRLGDTFIRAAQRAETEARDKQLQVEDAQRRYEAQAQIADELYRRAGNPDWMRSVDQAEALGVWEAAQFWADLDKERFSAAADKLTDSYQQAYGVEHTVDGGQLSPRKPEYNDGREARVERAGASDGTGWPADARHARTVADHRNGPDRTPARARAAMPSAAPSPAVRVAQLPRERGPER